MLRLSEHSSIAADYDKFLGQGTYTHLYHRIPYYRRGNVVQSTSCPTMTKSRNRLGP